jgi:hypothetical protein
MFFPPLQWALDVFNIHLIMLGIKNNLLTNYVVGSLVLVVISKISKLLSSSTFVQQHPFQVQPMDANDNNILKNKKQRFFVIFSTITLPCSCPISEDTR